MIDSSYALIKQEILKFDKGLEGSLQGSIEDFSPILNFFLNSQGKKIRPALGILFSKGLGNFTEKQNIFLQAVELIHNATLFHDDVIDGADERRNNESLNKKFSNKLAILSGDYFLSCALKNIAQLAHPEINSLLAECISQLCEGELEQDLNLYKIISMEKYLQKTERKTAKLFELTLGGCAILSEKPSKELINLAKKLGKNIRMVFQIRDDLKNFKIGNDKPYYNDLKSGIYTAPILFLAQENNTVVQLLQDKKYEIIIELLNNSTAFQQTKELLNKYYNLAEESLNNLPINEYSQALKELLSNLRDDC